MSDLVVIDGSMGEGGGQVLRTSLALSLVTGRPVRVENIRAGRKKPGLMRQHLTSVQAACAVGCARVEGAELGSREVRFEPGPAQGGEYEFSVGTAGSTTLVLQTILPALLVAEHPSRIRLCGGTHNPLAPPFDFLQRVFVPLVNRMGPKMEASLVRPGFYPAGGGECVVTVEPCRKLSRIDLTERGAVLRRLACATVSRLPRSIAERELACVAGLLGWGPESLSAVQAESPGPGNVV
ncbi:MAG: RNA 3'-terminal phosphate cyclase, partial [Thermoanaerobaculia bacterium]